MIKILGIVQGVGYRPYVYNAAVKNDIKGFVSNQGSTLVIDIEGEKQNIKIFLLQILKNPPALASIEKVKIKPEKYYGHSDFMIEQSKEDSEEPKFIPYDAAVCQECLNEISDPYNTRYRYAFANCTACGPRYTVIKSLPYDRKNTTMDNFKMCHECKIEYSDPADRRFHAQTNCCSHCGPSMMLLSNKGEEVKSEYPIAAAADLIKQGCIIAVKGIGGFHLACNAVDGIAVDTLRKRKNRPHKPLAIMVKDIGAAKKMCCINTYEERLLMSNKRPIVLLNRNEINILPPNIAPKLNKLGIMLPYAPLHHLLFQENIEYLVMTSGNISSSPIQYENNIALKALSRIADYFLIHNRDIYTPVEDSVVKAVNNNEVVIRRGRGYAPLPLDLKVKSEILALGSEQKNTFCLSQNGYCYISQYLGDLKDYDAYANYEKTINHLTNLLNIKPKIYACDLNHNIMPDRFIEKKGIGVVSVQHHHAHMVSCMAEHNLNHTVIGVIFDGTGLGLDNNIWGGEFFTGDRKSFRRAGYFKYVTIQGGDTAVKEPWRIALSYLCSINYDPHIYLKDIDKNDIDTVIKALEKNLNCFKTSSVGRFFDCVAALVNKCSYITYDAQGAIELESIIDQSINERYEFYIEEQDSYVIDYENILKSIIRDMEEGIPASIISAKFHNTLGAAAVETVQRIGNKYGINTAVLSGGVFENNYLLKFVEKGIKENGFKVFFNQQVPINDSGVSVGQLTAADTLGGE